jgi:hypothetical protein
MTTQTTRKKKWWWQTDFDLFQSPSNSYAEKTWCGNCREALYIFIRKGILKKEIKVTCTNCGCEVQL